MFLFPLRPGVERTREQIIEGGKNHPTQATHRAWSELRASFSWPPFPIFCSALPALHAQVDLSCLVCPAFCRFCCCQHANTAHRGSTAQLPAQLQICAPSHPGRRANAAPSSVDSAQKASNHPFLQRPSLRSTPSQLRSSGLLWQANYPPVTVVCCSSWGEEQTVCGSSPFPQHNTTNHQLASSLSPLPSLAQTQFTFAAQSHLLFHSSGRRQLRQQLYIECTSGQSESLRAWEPESLSGEVYLWYNNSTRHLPARSSQSNHT